MTISRYSSSAFGVRKQHKGFSLIELMVVVSILIITAAFAMPSFMTWIADSKTRTVAEAVQNGVRLAQAEAVKRGVQVEFVLTDDAPIAKDVTAKATGKNWVIQTLEVADPTTVDEFVEGDSLAAVSTLSLVSSSAATVTFNSLGRIVSPNKRVTYTINNPKGVRTLKVLVSVGGKVRMCDDDIAITTSSLGCP